MTDLIERLIPDGGPVDVHLCGAPPMIKAIATKKERGRRWQPLDFVNLGTGRLLEPLPIGQDLTTILDFDF